MAAPTTVSRPLFSGTNHLGDVHGYGYTLEVHHCGTCGVVWAIDEDYLAARRRDHKGWLCPNGHSFVYNGPSDLEQAERKAKQLEDRLAAERDRAGRLAADRDQLAASLRGTKANAARTRHELKRTRERAAAAVCPVEGCGRSFVQLRRHLASQHPDYVAAHDHEGATA